MAVYGSAGNGSLFSILPCNIRGKKNSFFRYAVDALPGFVEQAEFDELPLGRPIVFVIFRIFLTFELTAALFYHQFEPLIAV